jgi:hypothetical protein
MFNEWVDVIGNAIKENSEIEKKKVIFVLIGLIFYTLTFLTLFIISFLSLPLYLAWVGAILFFIAVTIFLYAVYINKKKANLFNDDILLYEIYYVAKKIDEYQKQSVKPKKKQLLKEIKEILQNIQEYLQNMEKFVQKSPEPDFNIMLISSIEKNIYSINYALSKPQEINEKILKSIIDFCEQRIELREKLHSGIRELIDTKLNMINKAIPDQNKNFGGYFYYIFRYKSFITQVIILGIIVTGVIIGVFGLILPPATDVSNDTLFLSACGMWNAIYLPLFGYLWLKNRITS